MRVGKAQPHFSDPRRLKALRDMIARKRKMGQSINIFVDVFRFVVAMRSSNPSCLFLFWKGAKKLPRFAKIVDSSNCTNLKRKIGLFLAKRALFVDRFVNQLSI